jgi:hypothetical protein
MTKDEALKLEALKYAASKGYGRDLLNMISAPFTIKETLAQRKQEPTCPECKAAVLYECVACSSNNYPPATQPLQEPVCDKDPQGCWNVRCQLGKKCKNTTPPAAQPTPVQEPVACAVCNKVHAILDADESKIIRNAKDGYPDGRAPRILTLQERVTALCVYASDWKRWCLEKENTTPPAAQRQWVGLTEAEKQWIRITEWTIDELIEWVNTKLKEKNT